MGVGAESINGGSPEWRVPVDQAPVSLGYEPDDDPKKVDNAAMKAGELLPVASKVSRVEAISLRGYLAATGTDVDLETARILLDSDECDAFDKVDIVDDEEAE